MIGDLYIVLIARLNLGILTLESLWTDSLLEPQVATGGTVVLSDVLSSQCLGYLCHKSDFHYSRFYWL